MLLHFTATVRETPQSWYPNPKNNRAICSCFMKVTRRCITRYI